jgi:predicted dienelactone hydrolase
MLGLLCITSSLIAVFGSLMTEAATTGATSIGATSTKATPSARGIYRVGIKTVKLNDATRNRPLTLEVWYPAKLEASAEKSVYKSTVGATPYSVQARAGRDAPILEPISGGAQKFPLIVYSHGQPGSRMQAHYLLEHLASQGYVVAALDHTQSTYADVTQDSYATGLVNRPLDILFAATEIPTQFPGSDANNIGLLGYSYGGYSSLNAAGIGLDSANLAAYCKRTNNEGPCFLQSFFTPLEAARGAKVVKADPRIKAVFVMAPYGIPWFSPQAFADMRVPLFVGGGSSDTVATYARDAQQAFKLSGSKNKYLLTLEAATHNPWIVCPPDVKVNAKDYERCSEPNWDHAKSHAVTQHFASAFFGRFLQNKPELEQYLTAKLAGLTEKDRVKLETR